MAAIRLCCIFTDPHCFPLPMLSTAIDSGDHAGALASGLSAVDICDDDIYLHALVMYAYNDLRGEIPNDVPAVPFVALPTTVLQPAAQTAACHNQPDDDASTETGSSRGGRSTRKKHPISYVEDEYYSAMGISTKNLGGTALGLGAQRESTGRVAADLYRENRRLAIQNALNNSQSWGSSQQQSLAALLDQSTCSEF